MVALLGEAVVAAGGIRPPFRRGGLSAAAQHVQITERLRRIHEDTLWMIGLRAVRTGTTDRIQTRTGCDVPELPVGPFKRRCAPLTPLGFRRTPLSACLLTNRNNEGGCSSLDCSFV